MQCGRRGGRTVASGGRLGGGRGERVGGATAV